jgi:hypothetical protein
MDDRTDFAFDEVPEPAVQEPQAAAAPVIVIEQSRSLASRLTGPVLILVLALAISSYQRMTPIRLERARPPADAAAAEVSTAKVPDPSASKIEVRATNHATLAAPPTKSTLSPPGHPPVEGAKPQTPQEQTGIVATDPAPKLEPEKPGSGVVAVPSPTPLAQPAAAPAALAANGETAKSPFDLDATDGLRPIDAPAAETPAAAPAAPPQPNNPLPPINDPPAADAANLNPERPVAAEPNPANNPIEANAAKNNPIEDKAANGAVPAANPEQILQDINKEAEQKQQEIQQNEQLKPMAQMAILADALKKVEESRVPFRKELERVLREHGAQASPEIDRLCDQFGSDTLPEVSTAYLRAQRRMSGKLSLRQTVEAMRMYGVPEPALIAIIARDLNKWMGSRGGPRDPEGVKVAAAKRLLTFPVTPRKLNYAPPADPAKAAAAIEIGTKP